MFYGYYTTAKLVTHWENLVLDMCFFWNSYLAWIKTVSKERDAWWKQTTINITTTTLFTEDTFIYKHDVHVYYMLLYPTWVHYLRKYVLIIFYLTLYSYYRNVRRTFFFVNICLQCTYLCNNALFKNVHFQWIILPAKQEFGNFVYFWNWQNHVCKQRKRTNLSKWKRKKKMQITRI